MLVKCGETVEGATVVAGVYAFYETRGLPLDLICEELAKRNMIPAWDRFYFDAIKAGVGSKKVITRIFECVQALRAARVKGNYVVHGNGQG